MLTNETIPDSRLRKLSEGFFKRATFEECVPKEGPVVLTEEEWDSVPHKAFPMVTNPSSELPYKQFSTEKMGLWLFILHTRDGKKYLINTEEFNYCRYAVECVKEYIPRVGHSILPYTGEE